MIFVWNLCLYTTRYIYWIFMLFVWENNLQIAIMLRIDFITIHNNRIGWYSIEPVEQLANCVNNDVSPISYGFDHLWHTHIFYAIETATATALCNFSLCFGIKWIILRLKLYSDILYILIFLHSTHICRSNGTFSCTIFIFLIFIINGFVFDWKKGKQHLNLQRFYVSNFYGNSLEMKTFNLFWWS